MTIPSAVCRTACAPTVPQTRCVVAARRRKCVENFRKTVAPRIGDARRPASLIAATAVPKSAVNKGYEHAAIEAILNLVGLHLLAEYSGVRPIISPATNTPTITSMSIPYKEPTPP